MAETARITSIGDQNAPEQPEKTSDTGKKQLPGESALWFRRYCIYRDLGHKRSLRAAVAKEQETARLVKEPEPATKSTAKPKKEGVNLSSSNQKQSKPVQVPGSWKHACKVYRWAERTQAFDRHLIDMMVITTSTHLGDTYANKYKRVQLLELLIKNTVDQFNHAIDTSATHGVYLAYIKQISGLLAQMEQEMSSLTDEELKAAIAAYGHSIRDEIEKACNIGQTPNTKKA